jgi:hypothetical protein
MHLQLPCYVHPFTNSIDVLAQEQSTVYGSGRRSARSYDTHHYRNKKYVNIGCLVGGRKLLVWTLGVLLAVAVLAMLKLVHGRRISSRLRVLHTARRRLRPHGRLAPSTVLLDSSMFLSFLGW